MTTISGTREQTDSPYAYARLAVALALATIGATGMYIVPVVLPSVQAEFGVARADASMPYSMLMIGFGIGGLMMGRLADRFGIMVPLLLGALGLGLGFVLASTTGSIWTFMLVHGVLIGFLGCSANFAPLIADTSLWFVRRRGLAVAICASGNYLGGTVWPGVVQHYVEAVGWRQTYFGLGVFCFVAMTALALFMRRRPPCGWWSRSRSPRSRQAACTSSPCCCPPCSRNSAWRVPMPRCPTPR